MGDWYSGSRGQGEAIYGLDRIKRGAGSGYSADQFDGRTNFRIFEYTLSADRTKKTSGITFTSTVSGKIPTILGVSGTSFDMDKADAISTPSRTEAETVADIYSIGGQKLGQLHRGINIIRMSDGTVRKVLVK